MSRVAILGSGEVGQALALGFLKHDYDVRIASRTPAKLADFARESGIPAVTLSEAAEWGEGAVLAVRGDGATSALELAGPVHLEGKWVIDTTNPIASEPPVDGVLGYFIGPNDSLLERLQKAYPKIRFVKAFNSVGSTLMVNPEWPGPPGTMFYCGDDDGAKKQVARIITLFGWEGWDMGTSRAARAIEPLAQLWCIPGFRENRWSQAFRLMPM